MRTARWTLTLLLAIACLAGASGGGAELLAPLPPSPDMALIPAGSFQMGDAFNEGDSDERPAHPVTVAAFFLDTREVRKALWDDVAAWAALHGYDIRPEDVTAKGPDHPASNATWYGAVKWANARSERDGRTPCYSVGGAVYRIGNAAPDCDWAADGYRLPTEAEWEKAARGGCEGHRFPWCDRNTIEQSQANYYSCPGALCASGYPYDTSPTRGYLAPAAGESEGTTPVASFAPNAYGLYDMAGNVYEWCWDWFDPSYYARSPAQDPHGPELGPFRVLRGGCWSYFAFGCRVAERLKYRPADTSAPSGFRLVVAAP